METECKRFKTQIHLFFKSKEICHYNTCVNFKQKRLIISEMYHHTQTSYFDNLQRDLLRYAGFKMLNIIYFDSFITC